MKYETRHSYTHKGCIFTSFRFCVGPLMMKSRCNWNPVSRSVFLANLASQPYKNTKSHSHKQLKFPLPNPFSSSNPEYHRGNKPNPASRQTYWDPNDGRHCPRGAAQTTFPRWCPPPLRRKKLGEGVGGGGQSGRLRIKNCVFATANSELSNVNYGFWIANYGNGFCTYRV